MVVDGLDGDAAEDLGDRGHGVCEAAEGSGRLNFVINYTSEPIEI